MALWRMRATLDDKPGFLALLTASLGLRSVNILSVQVHATEAGAVDEFLIDAPDHLTAAELAEAVVRGRGRDPWLSRSDVRGLVDEPTRVLVLAARVAADPGELEHALVSMLGGCQVTWRPDLTAGKEGYTDDTMTLLDPAGGSLVITRAAPEFTPAEYARAHALVRLAWVTSSYGSNR
jgi:hypothetical protein